MDIIMPILQMGKLGLRKTRSLLRISQLVLSTAELQKQVTHVTKLHQTKYTNQYM